MIWWILLWLGRGGGGPIVPTPAALPFLRRDGRDVSSLPTFVRRSP